MRTLLAGIIMRNHATTNHSPSKHFSLSRLGRRGPPLYLADDDQVEEVHAPDVYTSTVRAAQNLRAGNAFEQSLRIASVNFLGFPADFAVARSVQLREA